MILLTTEELTAAVSRALIAHGSGTEFGAIQAAAAALVDEEIKSRATEGDPLLSEVLMLRSVLNELDPDFTKKHDVPPSEADTRRECAELRAQLGTLCRAPDSSVASKARKALSEHALRIATIDSKWICLEAAESLL